MARTHVRTLGSSLAAVALAGVATVALAPAASAADCTTTPAPGQGAYATQTTCTHGRLSVTVVNFGNGTFSITFFFDGFQVGSTVTVSGASQPFSVGTFTADSNGAITGTATLPSSLPNGVHHIIARGVDPQGNAFEVSVPFTVTGSGSGSGLPFTGFELGAASLLGAGLLGAGTLAVVSGRKRKDSLTAV